MPLVVERLRKQAMAMPARIHRWASEVVPNQAGDDDTWLEGQQSMVSESSSVSAEAAEKSRAAVVTAPVPTPWSANEYADEVVKSATDFGPEQGKNAA